MSNSSMMRTMMMMMMIRTRMTIATSIPVSSSSSSSLILCCTGGGVLLDSSCTTPLSVTELGDVFNLVPFTSTLNIFEPTITFNLLSVWLPLKIVWCNMNDTNTLPLAMVQLLNSSSDSFKSIWTPLQTKLCASLWLLNFETTVL